MQGSGPAMAGFALTRPPEEGLFAMRSALGRLRFITTTAPKQFVLGIARETRTTHRKSMAYSPARERFFGNPPDRSFSIRLLLKRYATFRFACKLTFDHTTYIKDAGNLLWQKDLPRLIYLRRALSNELLLRAVTGTSFFTIGALRQF